jgi:hypothetical protein
MYYPPGGSAPMTKEERIADEHFFFSAFTDIKAAVADIVIQNDKAAVRIIMTCTHTGDFHGVAATGRRIAIPYLELMTFEEDLIKDEWAEFDRSAIIAQLQDGLCCVPSSPSFPLQIHISIHPLSEGLPQTFPAVKSASRAPIRRMSFS